MNKMKESYQKHSSIWNAIGLFLIYFLLMSAYKNATYFTDEGDNMLGAIALARGEKIYEGFFSQHLPMMYYLLYPFALLGVQSVVGFRLISYALLALCFVFIYCRYQKLIGKWPIICYGFCYIGIMVTGSAIGHTIVAEQFQSQYLVVLFLELYQFYKNKKLMKYSDIVIGLCIFLATTTAFVSIIPIAAFVVGMITIDIFYYIEIQHQFQVIKYIQTFFKKYYKVLLFTILPFIIFIFGLWITGTLNACYEQAFKLNTQVYSKYSGYSASPFQVMYSVFPNFIITFTNTIQSILKESLDRYIIFWFIYGIGVLSFIAYFIKKHLLFAIIGTIFILFCGNRTFTDFHAIPFFAATIIAILCFISNIQNKKIQQGILLSLCFLYFLGYTPYINHILEKPKTSKEKYPIINTLLEEGEYLYLNNLDTGGYIDTNMKPASSMYGLVPWFQELYEDKLIDDLTQNKPKVILYEPTANVWKYVYEDFAPKLDQFIKKNYTYVSEMNYWIKNDFLKEAEQKLGIKIPQYTTTYEERQVLNGILENSKLIQYFDAKDTILDAISIQIGTYNRSNYSTLTLRIMDNKKELTSITKQADQFIDNQFFYFDLEDVSLEKGKQYYIQIESEHTHINDYVTVYTSTLYDEKNYMEINGYAKPFSLNMNMYYK